MPSPICDTHHRIMLLLSVAIFPKRQKDFLGLLLAYQMNYWMVQVLLVRLDGRVAVY